jgi:endonuclease YncB( thermonuclease family)
LPIVTAQYNNMNDGVSDLVESSICFVQSCHVIPLRYASHMERRRASDSAGAWRAWLAFAALVAVVVLATGSYAAIRALTRARLDLAPSANTTTPAPAGIATPGPATGHAEAPGTAADDAPSDLTRVTVARVVDGDTVRVLMPDGTEEPVRLIGVNTPESTTRHEPYGEEASKYAKRALPKGRAVWLEFDVELRDRYGRILAYVWLEAPDSRSAAEIRAHMFNAELLLEGYASLMTIPPDVRYVDAFTPLQAEAREASRGLWGLPAP